MKKTLIRGKKAAGCACAAVGILGMLFSGTAYGKPSAMHVLSKTYTVDRIYRSMVGPQSTEKVMLLKTKKPELLWITGYEAVMVGANGKTPASQEFMCHSNLDFGDTRRHNAIFKRNVSSRLFTLSQGQFSIRFPEGFGLPALSDEALDLTTQVLNLNLPNPDLQVRHKVTIYFVRDRDLTMPVQPLFTKGAYGLKLLEGKAPYFGVEEADASKHGPGCLLGDNASTHIYEDSLGKKFTGHWVVKPGREINRTLVTKVMNIPFDTMLHYIAVHLHPFAETLELRDLTRDQSLFKSKAEGYADKIGLSRVEYFSSAEGIPVYKDHEYELVSTYNNTTSEDQDSMAVMYFYLADKLFQSPLQEGNKGKTGGAKKK